MHSGTFMELECMEIKIYNVGIILPEKTVAFVMPLFFLCVLRVASM